MPLQGHRRTMLCTFHSVQSHIPILACCGKPAIPHWVPSDANDAVRMMQPLQEGPRCSVGNTCISISSTSDDLTTSLNTTQMTPFNAIRLLRMHMQPVDLGGSVTSPYEQVSGVAHRCYSARSRSKSEAIEQLVLASEHLSVALPRGDAPQLDMTIIRCRSDHVWVIGMEDHIKNGLRMPRRCAKSQCPLGNIADPHGSIAER
mmetsp:Transcript_59784/g.142297  ORF Transcript_59784/g.142297 Transcript_59784/m.142297 type:complete len:203 (-) Transcript_59784:964-1572(-)